MDLSKIIKISGNKRKSKRVGRGVGSGKGGHTTGKGQKGQKSRTGSNIPVGFEGGQIPLYKRLPQIGGFRNSNPRKVLTVPLASLNVFDNDTKLAPKMLVEKGIIRNLGKNEVKILSNGQINKKLILRGFIISKSAQEKVEKAGGKVVS